ncbi:MAG: DUF3419 family protein [Bacilli bacterium]|nr:DUF3419 family protein [Bacilli bacterium]
MTSIEDAQKLIASNRFGSKGFSDYTPVYEYTTEDIGNSIGHYTSKDRVLTVLSSGDHVFNYILRGAEDIEAFDLNVITNYYYKLKRAIIEKLPFEEFLKESGNLVPYGLAHLEELNIDEETYMFWSFYRENQPEERYERALLKVFPVGSKRYNLYFYSDSYKRLQEVLKSGINIPFHHANTLNLHKSITGEFSEINLSSIYSLTPKKDIPKVIRRLKPHLTTNGQILFYSFWRADDKQYKKLHLPGKEINREDNVYVYKK